MPHTLQAYVFLEKSSFRTTSADSNSWNVIGMPNFRSVRLMLKVLRSPAFDNVLVQICVSRMFLVQVWHKCRGTDCCIVSAGKWFIPRRTLIRFARSVLLGRSLNAVAFVGNSFYSIPSTLLYPNRKWNCLPCFPLSSSNKVQCIL